MRKVYMDYAATTPVDPGVIEAMLPSFNEKFGNAMSLHRVGRKAKFALEESRETIAKTIKAENEEIFFTGSATESNSLALKSVAFANRKKGKHIIISQIEHLCVMKSSKWLEDQGFEVTRLPVDQYGLVNPADVERSIRKDTILVSIMHANNEIGTIEPIKEIGKICSERGVYFHTDGVYFHTDAAQTFGKLGIDVKEISIDMLTASSHKMYGPKGAACLYLKKGTRIEPILHGGGHEKGLRASTVNIPAIVGFAEATKICMEEIEAEGRRTMVLRDKLIDGALKIENSTLNGHPSQRLPNNTNFSFSFVEGESMVMSLDSYGISASTGSACSSEKLEPSYVLLSTGLPLQLAHSSLRLSLGRWTDEEDVDYVLEVLPEVIERLRKISPFRSRSG